MSTKKKLTAFTAILLIAVLTCTAAVSAALSKSEITAVQKKLISLGYLTSSANGSYNTATKNAVKTFKNLNFLTVDTNADSETLAVLDKVYGDAAKIKVKASSLNVRSGAGTKYSKLGTVKKGASYVVLATKKVSGVTWYNFRYGTKSGWVCGKYVTYTAADSSVTTVKTATITASTLNIRSGAGTKYSRVTTLKKGAVVRVSGSKTVSGTTWYSYVSNGRTLWFSGRYANVKSYIALKTAQTPEATTTTTTTTTTTSTTTTAVTSGTDVTTTAVTTTTAVSETDMTTVPAEETTTTTTTTAPTTTTTTAPQKISTKVQFAKVTASSLNLRKGAGTSYAKVASAKKGTEYAVLASKTVSGVKWYNILYKGDSVWACGSYLTIRTVASEVDRVSVDSYNTSKPNHLTRTAVINNDADILYDQPGTSSTPLAILKSGVTYDVYGDKGDGSVTWYMLNVDGIEGYISRHNVAITNYYEQVPERDFTNKTPVIYLSPSKQGANPYIIGDTSEKAEMEALGDIIYEKLKAYDCVVYLAPKKMELYDRAQQAYELNTDIYIAIHSNATGDSSVCYGPSAYYFPGCAQSKRYAECIVDSLNKVVPLGSNLNQQVISGMNLAGGFGYAEVREPGDLGMIGVLVETDFHDYAPTAQWLMDEKETAADAYVESLVNAFGLRLKSESTVSDSDIVSGSDAA